VKLNALAKVVSSSLNMSEERGERMIDSLLECIKTAIGQGKDVQLQGLGSFSAATKDGKPIQSLSKANLLGDLSAKMGETNENRMQTGLSSLIEAAKNEILSGNSVVMDDIGTLEVRFQKPEIEKQAKGHRLIRPAMSQLAFNCTKPIATPMGEGRIVFTPADDFRKKVEQFKQSGILLVVPERDFFVKTLEYYFENAGWDIEAITSIPDAVKRVESGKAYLVILDASFPDHQKFCFSLKSRRATSNTPLLMLYPSEQAWKVFKEVSIVGDENLPQPFEFRQLLDYADAEIIRAAEEELIFLQQIYVHLPTDEQSIEKVIDTVHKLLEHSGIGEEGQVSLSAAFREAVVNAAQHGNKYKREKKIEVQYLLDAEKITMVVKDQGAGFNHEMYVKSGSSKDAISAARERHQQGRMGGLGIMLMLRCCDRLEYNQQGNQITLTKYLKPQE
jgi:serine/threonine-protein kinase RsbW